MEQPEKLRPWSLVGGIASALLALFLVYRVFLVLGTRPGTAVWLYLLGLILAALSGFLQRNRPLSKYLLLAGALLVTCYYGYLTYDYQANWIEYGISDSVVFGYMALGVIWLLTAVGAIPRHTPRALVVIQAILCVLMAVLLYRWIGGPGFLSSPVVQIPLYILSACGLSAGRLPETAPAGPVTQPGGIGSADELMRYKELLDRGVLTQEEYEAKKRQLLGL